MPKRTSSTLSPLVGPGKPVDWLFVFKFNASTMPGDPSAFSKTGIFNAPGIDRPEYDGDKAKFSRHYLFASSDDQNLQLGKGKDTVGASKADPLGATFAQVYLAKTPPYYVVWNDDFYNDPMKGGGSPWGHSKGMLAWNDDGEGFILQVSTPSWPGAASQAHPRKTDGNTLGWITDDDIEVSQHFFALKLNKDDLLSVLAALHNASVHTDPKNLQTVHNGGPAHVQTLVRYLGKKISDTKVLNLPLSNGVRLISKPSALHVPPWQLVSAELGGVDLRVASWWQYPKIYSTTKTKATPACWDKSLGKPGAVDIATTGSWSPDGKESGNLGMVGGSGPQYNHAKLGVSTSPRTSFSIFGDMNQQGTLGFPGQRSRPCKSSQNGRGGLFFVLDDKALFKSMTGLLKGDSAPSSAPTTAKAATTGKAKKPAAKKKKPAAKKKTKRR